ncbi:ABC transporter ATP-binding protein [Pseudonocardia sp. DLS-67]
MGELPVATPAAARRAALGLARADAGAVTAMVALNALAATAGLAGPWLVGRILDEVRAGSDPAVVDRLALGILACAVVQLLLARQARWVAFRFGERTLSRVRERYVARVLELPTAVVERAGTGEIAARGTGDVAAMAVTLRDGGPALLIAAVQALFLLAAVVVVAPLLGACGLVGLVGMWFAARWYLRRAHAAYLAEGSATAALAEVLTATAAGARTVEALRLQERRIDASRAAVETAVLARERTLALRSVLFPAVDVCHVLPVVAVLLVGGALLADGAVTLGAVAAAALYLLQLAPPLNEILWRLEQLQSSTAAFARVEGVTGDPPGPPAARPVGAPQGERIAVRDVHFGYPGHDRDALRGVDLDLHPGERIALVGPSGAGKSTLGRLLAGLDAPRTGAVTVGGVPIADLDRAERRRHVVLVTQEHHVFLGTVRDNLLLADPDAGDDALRAALATVGGRLDELADGLDTRLGPGALQPGGAVAQQLALARVVIADPHTVVLDEATALLDPTSARSTERALAATLAGRTVVAIAHRLHTAHDADRVAVLQDGRITEIGAHDDLIGAGGAYAALWDSWHGRPQRTAR